MSSIYGLRSTETSRMPLVDEKTNSIWQMSDGRDMYIELASNKSREAKEARAKVEAEKRAAMNRQRGRFNYGDLVDTEAERDRQNLDLVVACTKGWLLEGENGEEIPFSPDAARDMYTTPELSWILDQAFVWIEDKKNFLSKS